MKAFVRMGKIRYVVSFLVAFSVLLAFGSVWAASGGGHGDSGAKVKDLIWRTMNFVVLAGGLIYLARKPIAQGLRSRAQGIKEELDELERRKQDAAAQLAGYKEKLSALEREVEKIVAEYIREGEEAKARIIEDAKLTADKLQQQAKKNIEHEFNKAKQQLRAEMAEQAVAMAEELIKKNIKPKDQKSLIDEYLKKVVVAQ